VTCIKNLEKFGHAVFELREQTDRKTDRQNKQQYTYSSQYFVPYCGQSNNEKATNKTNIVTNAAV